MTYGETLTLIRAMAQSGEAYSFPDCVDKHLTGVVGGKIGLTSLPFVAACGAPSPSSPGEASARRAARETSWGRFRAST